MITAVYTAQERIHKTKGVFTGWRVPLAPLPFRMVNNFRLFSPALDNTEIPSIIGIGLYEELHLPAGPL